MPAYLFFRLALLLGYLPFGVLYRLSDGLYYVFNYVIRYRRKVVTENLERCFPDKTPAEINDLRKAFYRHFGDIVVEGFKGLTASHAELAPRYVVTNAHIVADLASQGKSCVVMTAHYNNWEWALPATGHNTSAQIVTIFKPIGNPRINEYVRVHSANLNNQIVSIKQTAVTFERAKTETILFLMASDQSPSNTDRAIRADFFGWNLPCPHGMEVYSKMYDLPIYFAKISRVKRGYYELDLIPISENSAETADGYITQRYMSILEEIIKENPANWLWSHRRWKRL